MVSNNPKPPQAPPNFSATPTSLIDNAKRLIKHSLKIQNQVADNVQLDAATFTDVLLPLAHAENALASEANTLTFYGHVSPDSKLRDASSEAQKLLDDHAIETAMREDIFDLVCAVMEKKEDLDLESYLFLKKKHKDYVRNGLKLSAGSTRVRFRHIKERISQIAVDFCRNLNESNGSIWFHPQELEGVPEDVVSRLEKGEAGEHKGKLRLTLELQNLYPALRYATNCETRRRIYIADANECAENVPLFQEAMVLRDEAARLLGYPNHAAFRLEEKMAKEPETVNCFLGGLRSQMADGSKREIEALKLLKMEDLESREESFDGRFYLWDQGFYNRLMLEKQYLVDHQKIAEYFPLQSTTRGMLDIFQHLLGLVFVENFCTEKNVWHEDVQAFSVWDTDELGGGFVGYLYLDLFSREGKGNPANFNLSPGFIEEDGARHYPATALLCSFSKPTSTKPSLLRHDNIVIMFHELGHGIHDLVSRTRYSRFHGTNTVIDFGEAPSQMLENWCWTPTVLKSLSCHYSSLSVEYLKSWEEQTGEKSQPPEKIPDDVIRSLVDAKYVNSAIATLRQLHLGIFDMTVHQPANHEAIETMDISVLFNTLRREIMQMDGPEVFGQGFGWGHGQTSFAHLLGDYDAGYYGYLSSQVYSTDMFYAAFKADPMNAQEGRRYRYTVLEKGGSQDEMQTLIDFLGREPRTDAFYQELGLA